LRREYPIENRAAATRRLAPEAGGA